MLAGGERMFRDQRRTTDPEQTASDDATIADDGIVFTANLTPHGTRVCRPEISLVAAVFEDAVRCVQRGSRGVTHQQSSDACEWIASERRDWPFDFVNGCDFLGMDAKAVRTRLRINDVRPHARPSTFASPGASDAAGSPANSRARQATCWSGRTRIAPVPPSSQTAAHAPSRSVKSRSATSVQMSTSRAARTHA